MPYTFQRGADFIDVTLDYDIEPVIPASGPDNNGPGSPPEGGEIQRLEAYDTEGNLLALTDAEYLAVEKYVYDHHDRSDDGWSDPDDWSYD